MEDGFRQRLGMLETHVLALVLPKGDLPGLAHLKDGEAHALEGAGAFRLRAWTRDGIVEAAPPARGRKRHRLTAAGAKELAALREALSRMHGDAAAACGIDTAKFRERAWARGGRGTLAYEDPFDFAWGCLAEVSTHGLEDLRDTMAMRHRPKDRVQADLVARGLATVETLFGGTYLRGTAALLAIRLEAVLAGEEGYAAHRMRQETRAAIRARGDGPVAVIRTRRWEDVLPEEVAASQARADRAAMAHRMLEAGVPRGVIADRVGVTRYKVKSVLDWGAASAAPTSRPRPSAVTSPSARTGGRRRGCWRGWTA